jgi:hypothetical protein
MSSFIAHLKKRGGYSTTELDSNKNKQLDIIMSFLVAKQPWSTVGIMVAKWFPTEEDWTIMSVFVNRGDVTETEKNRHLNYYLNQREDTSMTESERKAREESERKAKEEAERKAKEEADRRDKEAELASRRFFDGCIPGVYPSGPCMLGVGGFLITGAPAIRMGPPAIRMGPSMIDATPFGRPGPTPVSWSEIISATPSHHFGGGGGGIGLSSLAPPVINYRGGR